MIVLAYAIMSNHFHIFIYVPEPEEIGDEEILRRINALYREASLAQVLGEWTRLKDEEAKLLGRARPTEKYVSTSTPGALGSSRMRRTTIGAATPQRPGATRRRGAAMPSCTATVTGRRFAVVGEGPHCANRSRSSAVATAEILPDMSYYISDTMSMS